VTKTISIDESVVPCVSSGHGNRERDIPTCGTCTDGNGIDESGGYLSEFQRQIKLAVPFKRYFFQVEIGLSVSQALSFVAHIIFRYGGHRWHYTNGENV